MPETPHEFTLQERRQYKNWLSAAFAESAAFDGSEAAENRLLRPLILIDEFVRARNGGTPSAEMEAAFAVAAWPDLAPGRPRTTNAILEETGNRFYGGLAAAESADALLALLEKAGTVVKRTRLRTR